MRWSMRAASLAAIRRTTGPPPPARSETRSKCRVMTRHFDLVSDLAGGGGPVVRLIAAKLAARIDHLIAADEQAAAYLALLTDLQAELRVGARVVQDEVQDLFEREG